MVKNEVLGGCLIELHSSIEWNGGTGYVADSE